MTKIYFEDSDDYIEVPSPEESLHQKAVNRIAEQILGFKQTFDDDEDLLGIE